MWPWFPGACIDRNCCSLELHLLLLLHAALLLSEAE